MSVQCTKLSPIVSRNGENWTQYLASLYDTYKANIPDMNFRFNGKPIKVNTNLNYNLQHVTFDHITTMGSTDRLYNEPRCERIVWVKDILGQMCTGCDYLHIFRDYDWKSADKKRFIVWCTLEDYVIILEERKNIVMIISAYCVLYTGKKESLMKKLTIAQNKRKR